MEYQAGAYEIAVIGAGHAGIEAALAAARLGLRTVCFTINLDAVGNMPCNPAIGGTGKGHLVRELDALGGEMAKAADRACIQYRVLNKGKGPAGVVPPGPGRPAGIPEDHEAHPGSARRTSGSSRPRWWRCAPAPMGPSPASGPPPARSTPSKPVVVCTGTYLEGRTILGEIQQTSGPDGLAAALPLAGSLRRLGVSLRRFKTGTPPGFTDGAWTSPGWSARRGTRPPCPSPSRRRRSPKTGRCAGSPTPTRPPTPSSGPT